MQSEERLHHLSQILVEMCSSGHLCELPDQHCGIPGGGKLECQLTSQQLPLGSLYSQQVKKSAC